MRSPGPCPKQKTISFAEITKPDHRILNTFYFTKISYVWGIVQAAAPEGGAGDLKNYKKGVEDGV